MFWRDKEKMSKEQKQQLCCMCWKPAEYYAINKKGVKEYLCRYCAQINEEIKRLK